jgi:hypothetical protein
MNLISNGSAVSAFLGADGDYTMGANLLHDIDKDFRFECLKSLKKLQNVVFALRKKAVTAGCRAQSKRFGIFGRSLDVKDSS